MIKQFIVSSMIVISLSTAIAQPIDYVSELATIPAPQNYFYDEIPTLEDGYDMNLYRPYQIIHSEKIVIKENVWFTDWYCTSYVASQRPDLFPGQWENRISGDAKDRLINAKIAWIDTGKIPQVWAIAVFEPGKWALSRGHVAIVEYVWDNGLIIVKDMNFKWKNMITTRVIPADLAVWYIY